MTRFGRWAALGAVLAAGLVSLVGSGGGGGGSAPAVLTVVGTSPTNGATGVSVGTAVTATFSENLAATPTFTLSGGAGAVAGAVSRSGATATFTPTAALAFSTTYTASVSGASGAGGGAQTGATTWSFTTQADPNSPPGTAVTISGTADFQSVPNDTATDGGLLYGSITNRPIRGATVEVLPAGGGAALASGTTSSAGTYSLTISSPQSVIVRVRAEMKKTSGAGGTWDFTVRDNTQGNALYVLDSTAFTPVAGANTKDLRAGAGWGGTSYTATRAAAPFAILDTVYDSKEKLLSASANAAFPALQLMWSVSNRPVDGDRTQGLIGTSFYEFSSITGHRIYVLGSANEDTDEFDRTVIAHEFGHYFQNVFSRDDSLGGGHTSGDRLDMRVAFSEGWGNGWSGIAVNTPVYADSNGTQQQSGFILNLALAPTGANRGWYSEATVQYLIYTWGTSASIGFAPIFAVLSGFPTTLTAQATVSSIHHFAHFLKQQVPAQAAAIDSLLAGQLITVGNPTGSTETNSGGIADALPVYRTHTAAIGAAQNYCLTDAAGTGTGEFNKLGANLFIRFTLAAAGTRVITVTTTTAGVTSDPDFSLIRIDGTVNNFVSSTPGSETSGNISLAAGTQLIVLTDDALTSSGTNNGQRCFNVTIQ